MSANSRLVALLDKFVPVLRPNRFVGSLNQTIEHRNGATAGPRGVRTRLDDKPYPCYNILMKIIERWLLFTYVGGQFTPLSKPFKTKDQAEKARLKLPERERRKVAMSVIRLKK
jgi:hypothetical protein